MRRLSVLLALLLASTFTCGAPARVYSVKLTWTPSSSSGVAQYKVYRGTSSGGETLLTTIGNVTTYTDSPIFVGTTYYYQVTAINTNAQEGPRSSEIAVQVGAVTLRGVTLSGRIGVVFVPVSSPFGPPDYNGTTTSTAIVPTPVISMGLVNSIVYDTSLNPSGVNPILRATDGNSKSNLSIDSTRSGGDNDQNWNCAGTTHSVACQTFPYYYFFITQGGANQILSLDPATFQISNPVISGPIISDYAAWSGVDPRVFYRLNWNIDSANGKIYKDTLPAPPAAPNSWSETLVYDFANCSPSGAAAAGWTHPLNPNTFGPISVGPDDQTFYTTMSQTGGQGTGKWVINYRVGQGCQVWDTTTGIVYGEYGTNGSIVFTDSSPNPCRFNTHDGFIVKGGDFGQVSISAPITACGNNGGNQSANEFWTFGTNIVNDCGTIAGNNCGGHQGNGFDMVGSLGHTVTCGASLCYQLTARKAADPLTTQQILYTFDFKTGSFNDNHLSWNDAGAGTPNSGLIIGTTTSDTLVYGTYDRPGIAEIYGILPGQPRVRKRFAHSFNVGDQTQRATTRFRSVYGIGTVSQDGRYWMWVSDWGGTAAKPRIGFDSLGNPRYDIFVMRLD